MPDVEVHIDVEDTTLQVGLLRRHAARGGETITFEYEPAWLAQRDAFSLEPALALTRGVFVPQRGQLIFGSIGDSAPDTWGRRLMQRSERRQAEREGRAVRTLSEADYLLGVSDETRLRDRIGRDLDRLGIRIVHEPESHHALGGAAPGLSGRRSGVQAQLPVAPITPRTGYATATAGPDLRGLG